LFSRARLTGHINDVAVLLLVFAQQQGVCSPVVLVQQNVDDGVDDYAH